MSIRGYKIRDQQAIHFITFAVVEWVDVFSRQDYAEMVVDSLKFCQEKKGLNIHAWVIMSNHLHLLVSAKPDNKLSDILRDFKKFTSSRIIKAIEGNKKESRRNWMLWIFKSARERNKRNENYQFWRQENHPVECFYSEILESKKRYIHKTR
ncbi:MAG: transposase [Cyclobacteriaceae bacterium]|nr:transposase [Cyclobacteriaceae bacterium]